MAAPEKAADAKTDAAKTAPVVAKAKAAPAPVAAKPTPPAAKPAQPAPRPAAAPQPVAATATSVEAVSKATVAVSEPVEKELEIMQTTVENTAKNTQAQAKAMFGDMSDRTKGAMEKSAKMVEEMNDFAKGNLEAMVESSRIAAKGMESIGQEAAEFSRKSFEQATATMKSMASVKSPTELFKLQSDFMRSAFDMYVAEASKTTEHMMKLAGDAAQPLSNRMAVAADKVKVAA
ncbi:phasin family protein [Sphingomonas japonica]|uniref:Phasin family protein n=1 Tax=Sphingomonas japonica TaxID=511662 RepID=A0ABX0U1N7_9SPHN|nr:phasin family protein [Sphingomonas japonica]NIJ23262.1 phasin family protein [Sphingomonas japonica]